ncbi:MAG: hypothetical protein ACOC4G_13780 [Bacillota bacterium]
MEEKELLEELIEITRDGFGSVKLLPETIKKNSEGAYLCILETLEEKAKKDYIDSQSIADFKKNNLSVRIELITCKDKVCIKEISLIKNETQILILQGLMNVYLKNLIDKIGPKLPEIILKKLQEQKSK